MNFVHKIILLHYCTLHTEVDRMPEVQVHSAITEFDVSLFQTGKHYRLYEKLGAHLTEVKGVSGAYFSVYAPAAAKVCVRGDFTLWEPIELFVRWDGSGIWEGFVPGVKIGQTYKYQITSDHLGSTFDKADPFARYAEKPPATGSRIWKDTYQWKDKKWMKNRGGHNSLSSPWSVYEMHLASWRKRDDGSVLSYHEMAEQLPAYLTDMGFTHVEFLPVMEHPYDPSWGYQVTGFYAPTSRFGDPEGLKVLIDALHQAGIAVILDWVPSHFPSDGHGPARFDGSCVFEHPDWRKGYQPDWDSLIFNYERPEVCAFLISNALFWLDEYHIDGLRVDAVASMLYLDYSREEGGWEPNIFGGRENLEAIAFLKALNEAVYTHFPDTQMIAEESTAFPKVSHPTYDGGLGFGMKWMMGWMHDTLNYFKNPTVYRKFHHGSMSFSIYYGFSENFVLPFSHDEVVHGKASLLHKMPGDDWQKFANLRLLYSYMFAHPGGKLLFMGAELAQRSEWNFAGSLDWENLQYAPHQGIQSIVRDLNQLLKENGALHEQNFEQDGFEWIDFSDNEQCILAFLRKGSAENDVLLVVCNFTEVERKNYELGVPDAYAWKEIFNSDSEKYGGSGMLNTRQIRAKKSAKHGRSRTIKLTLPPLGATILKPVFRQLKKG